MCYGVVTEFFIDVCGIGAREYPDTHTVTEPSFFPGHASVFLVILETQWSMAGA